MFQMHPAIDTPADETILWRYMNLERFLALLHARALYLARLDSFVDPWEGVWPNTVVQALKSEAGEFSHYGTILEAAAKLKYGSFVSCWHASSTESAALWDLYSGKSGVAIRSTVKALKRALSFPASFFIGSVRYLDFDKEAVPVGNMLVLPFLKRKSFEHEKEVRVLYWDPKRVDWNNPEAGESGIAMEVDPAVLIDEVYLSPASPDWLLKPLEELCVKFGFDVPVIRSSLYDKQVY
ncbi:DUF2971 domain-containing protein [Pseudoxanthomonas mexicana]|uniref:DUF2971 domain-containing protein n=1 Tax=Pseudoxanthomonas mexicana TaxID=128785 RepID=UPI001FD66287|nr:DUF2971 domain-containing protein [Pseudoxanthomonas mexicana]UOV01697.1 DUF2971 domain-containing protein [Pseudoxanthomonas mexicana]